MFYVCGCDKVEIFLPVNVNAAQHHEFLVIFYGALTVSGIAGHYGQIIEKYEFVFIIPGLSRLIETGFIVFSGTYIVAKSKMYISKQEICVLQVD